MSTDSDPTRWELPPHTLAKHQILSSYLDGWFPVLGSTHGRIVFLDGFAGRGRYNDGSPGSPIIALDRLLTHKYFPNLADREFVFIFVEHDASNVQSLRQEIDEYVAAHQPWPTNVKWEIVEDSFASVADDMITDLRAKQANMAPLFAFIDPFGFQGLPMTKLAELCSWPRAELCINFAANNINRFLHHDGVQEHIENLFGCTRDEVLQGYSGQGVRLPHLREVYADRLRAVAKLQYVQSFEMRNLTGNVSYFLFHATNSPKGVSLMKAAMWKVAPGGGFAFSDRLAGQDVLFAPVADLHPLRDHLTSTWGGRGPIMSHDVKQDIELHTPYRSVHATEILRAMEKDGTLEPDRSAGSKRGTFAPHVPLVFPAPAPRATAGAAEQLSPAQAAVAEPAVTQIAQPGAATADVTPAPLSTVESLYTLTTGGGDDMGIAASALVDRDELTELVTEYIESRSFEDDVPRNRDEAYEGWQEQVATVEVTIEEIGVSDDEDETATASFTAVLEIRRDLTGPNDSGDGLAQVTEVQRARVSGSVVVSIDAELDGDDDDPEYEPV